MKPIRCFIVAAVLLPACAATEYAAECTANGGTRWKGSGGKMMCCKENGDGSSTCFNQPSWLREQKAEKAPELQRKEP